MKNTKLSIEEKLKNLYRLQLIDSRIDEIRNLRGGLPLEIKMLDNELHKLLSFILNIKNEIITLEKKIKNKKSNIKASEILIKKYKIQQNKIRNNKELEFLKKEIEFQELEIQLSQKNIKEYISIIDNKKNLINKNNKKYKEKKEYLLLKEYELKKIISDNKEEEEKVLEKSKILSKLIDTKLLQIYKKIRKGVKHGFAVVPVKRGASMGSYLFIPPQVHSDLIQRKNIIIDEHSGCILIDSSLANEIEKEFNIKKN